MSVLSAAPSAKTAAKCAVISEAQKEWTKIFPLQVTQTYTSSVTFMKQLTTIAVSTITFLKQIFPEECYEMETFGGLKLRILKTDCDDELAQIASTALLNSFDALEKKYLHKLVLCLYEGSHHPDNLVETHAFEFTYKPAGVSLGVRGAARGGGAGGRGALEPRYSFEDVRERTLHLLKACVVMMTHAQSDRLGSHCDLTIRLYYNDDAPAEYQAPGYSAAAEDGGVAAALADAEPLGAVHTPYHALAHAAYLRDDTSSRDVNASVTIPTFTQDEMEDIRDAMEQRRVRCVCGLGDDAGEMLTCKHCGTLQHAACFGVWRGAAPALRQHCCARCADAAPTRAPTCDQLAALPDKQRQALSVYRRALAWCCAQRCVSAAALTAAFRFPPTAARRLMRLLHSHHILDHDDGIQKIDHEQLKTTMERLFGSEENMVVERLLEESQRRSVTPDPVQEALRPTERVGLRSATDVAEVVPHTSHAPRHEDSTLERYREAFLSADENMNDELPLSGSHNPVKHIEKMGDIKVSKRKMAETEKRSSKFRLRTKKIKVTPQKENGNAK